ncbi:aquaporin [Microcella sp.]|uniref:aquaporin n=1 Tax=Microcella sp. TaxID=1913979 RepID=UPI00299F67F7|nr:aquaporin [Microcella sp.]MDX2026815.1 aquaporin [Microcella sp.]
MAKVTASTPSTAQRLTAEAFGTFLLVGGVIGTAFFSSANTGLLGPALAVGLAVMGGAYAVGHISGAHFNPAVTIGAAVAGRFAWKDVPGYVIAQFVGGLLATSVLVLIGSFGPAGALADAQAGGFFSNGFDEGSPAGYGLVAVIVAELVLTAVFLVVILGVTDGRAPAGFAPLAIGLTLTVLHLVAIPVSNASFNPARSLATAVYGGPDALMQVAVFLIVPVVGAVLGALLHRGVFAQK